LETEGFTITTSSGKDALAGMVSLWHSVRDATYSYRNAHIRVAENAEETKSAKGERVVGGAPIFCS